MSLFFFYAVALFIFYAVIAVEFLEFDEIPKSKKPRHKYKQKDRY